jgi:molecular chaperone GrpE
MSTEQHADWPDPADQPEPQTGAAPGQSGAQRCADAADGGSGSPDLTARLAEAEAKAAENFELYMRARAEMENIRRRAQEDIARAHKYAIESFAEDMLPVKDSLEMALSVETPTVEILKEGVEATLRQIESAFEKNKLLVIDPSGQKFDPNKHQAISTVAASATNPPVASNHVVMVLQKGYLINDRILRPALVTVAQG